MTSNSVAETDTKHEKSKKPSMVMQIFSKVSKSKTDDPLLETSKFQNVKIKNNLTELENTLLIKNVSQLEHSEQTSKPKIKRSNSAIQKNLEKVKQDHDEWLKHNREISQKISESGLNQTNLILENKPDTLFNSKEFFKASESRKIKSKHHTSLEAVHNERVKQVKEIRKILPNVCEICSCIVPETVKEKDILIQHTALCNCDKDRSKSVWTQKSLDIMSRELGDEKTRLAAEGPSASLLLSACSTKSGSISESAKLKQKKIKQRKQNSAPKETIRPEFKVNQFVIKFVNKSTT